MSQEIPSISEQIPILINLIVDDKRKSAKRFLKQVMELTAVALFLFSSLLVPLYCAILSVIGLFSPLL